MEVKFGTPKIHSVIDKLIYLYVKQGELSERQARILDYWSEKKGNTLKLLDRMQYWEVFLALQKRVVAAGTAHHPIFQ